MWLEQALSLEGRVALVTGGGSGIGKNCAKQLAHAGAKVVIVGRRAHKLEEVKKEIEAEGGTCYCFSADLTKEENCKASVQACVDQFGRLDIVVNNAGTGEMQSTLEKEFDTDYLTKTMAIDFNAVFWITKYAYPECQKNGVGSIINISSIVATYSIGPIPYTAAKGAVSSMTRLLGSRFGSLGVRINAICPGSIITEMTEPALADPENEKLFRSFSPLNMLGYPDDIGYFVTYLASDAARFITGQDFIVDGGLTVK